MKMGKIKMRVAEPVADLRRVPRSAPPPTAEIFFGKFGKIVGWRPLLLGNPGFLML